MIAVRSMNYEAMVALGAELHARLAPDQALLWARILSQIAGAATPQLAAPCAWVANSITALLLIPVTHDDLSRPVLPSEACWLGHRDLPISFKGAVQLAGLLYVIEQEMGAGHSTCVLIRWYQAGRRSRMRRIVRRDA